MSSKELQAPNCILPCGDIGLLALESGLLCSDFSESLGFGDLLVRAGFQPDGGLRKSNCEPCNSGSCDNRNDCSKNGCVISDPGPGVDKETHKDDSSAGFPGISEGNVSDRQKARYYLDDGWCGPIMWQHMLGGHLLY